MLSMTAKFRILHVLRAPVGGLFRHVLDLALEQAKRGHEVGIVADSSTGGAEALDLLAAASPRLRLGVERFPMRRQPHVSDLTALLRVARAVARRRPDIIHGHGSKGGFFARATGFLPGFGGLVRAYTPHGGSFHQQPGYKFFIAAERLLARQTEVLLFESEYIAGQFTQSVGPTRALQVVARNGLRAREFAPAPARRGAAEFVYIGELATYKGVDTLIRALAIIHASGASHRLAIVGLGGERDMLTGLVERLGLESHVGFHGLLPAREAFTLGQIVVAPSRAESLPYLVMEAIAAQKDVIATDVGGVGEIFRPLRGRLIASDNPPELARAMVEALRRDPALAAEERAALSRHVASHFNVDAMTEAVLGAYQTALERRQHAAGAALSPQTGRGLG
jgi:glycosyltransferase involved in cell wall biosynthesis